MKQIKIILLIILVCITIANNNVIGKKSKKKLPKTTSKRPHTTTPVSDSFIFNRTIMYAIDANLSSYNHYMIKSALQLMEQKTCFNFSITNNISSHNTLVFKWNTWTNYCAAMAEYKDRYIIYKILVSKDCIRRRDRLQKLMYWSLEMRYQMEQCLQNKTNGPGQGNITDRLMPDVLRKYRCNAAHLNETSHFLEPYSFGYYPKKVPKTDNIEPKNLEQKDYSAEFSFTNLKTLNSRMCNDKCQNDSSKYCKNKALRSPRNCDECLCPFFYKGKKCFEFEKSKYCGDQKLKAISKQKNKFLDFKSDCYYIIKPKGKSKKVLLKFQAIGDAYWACDEDKLIEIRYSRDKSIEGVIPCGHIRNFTVKGYKGVSILVYTSELAYEFSKMAYEFKLKMEYREVRA